MAPLPYQLGTAGRYAFELSGHAAGQGMDLVLVWARMNPRSLDRADRARRYCSPHPIAPLRLFRPPAQRCRDDLA